MIYLVKGYKNDARRKIETQNGMYISKLKTF